MNYKKLVVTEPWKVELQEDNFNEKIEGGYEVIFKNRFSHISAGTEMACLSGLESWFQIPATPGYTAVAEVVEKGGDADVEVGDLVYTFGPHAGYFKRDITDRWGGVCVKVPGGLNPEHAAFTHMAGIAMTSIRNSSIELGDYVLVVGLGAIGNIASQLAQLQGANVIAVDINDTRIKIARECGIKTTINSTRENLKDKVMEITGGKGVDTLVDASGVSKVIESSLELIKLYGEAILLGSPRAPYQTNLTDTLQKVHLLPHCITMKGALEFTFPTHETEFVKHSIERNSAIIMDLMNEGRLSIDPLYTHKLDPSEAQSAYEGLRDKPDDYIGVIFEWK